MNAEGTDIFLLLFLLGFKSTWNVTDVFIILPLDLGLKHLLFH